MLSKNAVKPALRRELVDYVRVSFRVGVRRACRVIGISDALYRYQPDRTKDEPVMAALQEAVERSRRMASASCSRSCAAGDIPGTTSACIDCTVG